MDFTYSRKQAIVTVVGATGMLLLAIFAPFWAVCVFDGVVLLGLGLNCIEEV